MAAPAAQLTPQAFSGRDFRSALGAFATGVTVVTTSGEDHYYGMTANAFSSLSLDPPMILVCVKSGGEGHELIEQNGVFAVNVLSSSQEPISNYFASRERPRGLDAFKEIAHQIGSTGCPIIDGSLAHLDCRLDRSFEAGDHVIFVGEVLSLGVLEGSQPLLFHGGGYRLLADA